MIGATGTTVRFADGHTALCGTSGLWNVPFGYGNEAVNAAVSDALREASYLTLFRYGHPWAEAAAERLIELVGAQHYRRVLYGTSGSSALDAAIKICRQYWQLAGQPKRDVVVSLRGSYHGMTFGAHALSGEDLCQRAYGADQRRIRHVSASEPGELRRLVTSAGDSLAAIVIEPLLGSGAMPVADEVIDVAVQARRECGVLVVADEVATGFWRTGPFVASGGWSETPDLLVLSKALTNGTCAASALLWGSRLSDAFDAADAVLVHGETQAGTPASCAAMIAVIEEAERLDAAARIRNISDGLDVLISKLLGEVPLAIAATGKGGFRGIVLRDSDGCPIDAEHITCVIDACLARGAVVQPGPSCIQLIPALVYSPPKLEQLVSVVAEALNEVAHQWV
jgi:adenosylmethionine-8-amino-7-oxononanoate aminotransferase